MGCTRGYTPKWVIRKGGATSEKYKVTSISWDGKILFVKRDEVGFVLPADDYIECDPPSIIVTNDLHICDGYVCYKDEKIAKLCCNGNFTVSFNPFKVEMRKIR